MRTWTVLLTLLLSASCYKGLVGNAPFPCASGNICPTGFFCSNNECFPYPDAGHIGTSGSTGFTGTTGRTTGTTGTSSGTGCSSVSVTQLCDETRPVPCTDDSVSCPVNDCSAGESSCSCPTNAVCANAGTCNCGSGFALVHCDTGRFCTGPTDCPGGSWWCHPFGSQYQPGCTGELTLIGGTCNCNSGKQVAFGCNTNETCQELCQ